MLIKIHKAYRDVVAICDKELLGKLFEEGKFQLDLKESFFGGEKLDKEEIIKAIKELSREDATFNIVGERSVSAALEAEIISSEGIKKIKGIPFALVLM